MSKITIDTLAAMMKTSFEDLQDTLTKKINDVRDELKEEIEDVKDQLDKMENNHERRISILEDDVRVLKTTVNREK